MEWGLHFCRILTGQRGGCPAAGALGAQDQEIRGLGRDHLLRQQPPLSLARCFPADFGVLGHHRSQLCRKTVLHLALQSDHQAR